MYYKHDMKSKKKILGTEAPNGSDIYDPGVQVRKAVKPGVASSEKVVKNLL